MKTLVLIVTALALAVAEESAPSSPYVPLAPEAQARSRDILTRQEALKLEYQALYQEAQAIRWKACAANSVPEQECGDWDGQGHLMRLPKMKEAK